MTLAQAPETNEEPQVEDRRAAIAAAFEEHSTPEPTPEPTLESTPAPTSELETDEQVAPKPADEKSVVVSPAETDVAQLDKPPQSWKPAEKAKWAQLDPDIRQEVLRRERQVTAVLNESAQARGIAQEFAQAVQPFMARVHSMGLKPAAAVKELFAADHILSTAPAPQRAQFMAKLIKDYDIDVVALDAALSGAPVADPVDSRVEQLLQQRLAPFQNFLNQQQQLAQRLEQESQQKAQETIESMSNNPKFPYFEQVRQDMADFIEIAAKKNISLGLEEAYNKAVMSDPVLSKQISTSNAAATANAQAQRALRASKSVSGAPRTEFNGAPAATDRRAIIEAAFDQAAGR